MAPPAQPDAASQQPVVNATSSTKIVNMYINPGIRHLHQGASADREGNVTTKLESVEARLIALELLFRGMLSSLIGRAPDPFAEVDRMKYEFLSTLDLIRFEGIDAEEASRMRSLISATVSQNFNAIRSRVAKVRAH